MINTVDWTQNEDIYISWEAAAFDIENRETSWNVYMIKKTNKKTSETKLMKNS